jgi:hypothetical protein
MTTNTLHFRVFQANLQDGAHGYAMINTEATSELGELHVITYGAYRRGNVEQG